MMRICAVIVTYNRPQLLVRCVTAVLNQTRRPDAVIVVDNCSQIPAANLLNRSVNELQIFRFSENTGGAGGFHFGLAEGFRQRFDGVWLMDDDGIPSESCLMNLIEVAVRAKIGFANPLVVDESESNKLVFGLAVSGNVVLSTDAAIAAAKLDVIENAINPFNGSLILRDAYNTLGDIKFECFVWGDEEEYFERARAAKIKIGTVTSATYLHPATKGKTVKFGPRKSELKLCPSDRSRFYFRNIGFSKNRYRGALVAIYHGCNYLGYLLMAKQFSEAGKFVSYYIDGVFNLYLLRPSRSTLLKMLTQVIKVDLHSHGHAVREQSSET